MDIRHPPTREGGNSAVSVYFVLGGWMSIARCGTLPTATPSPQPFYSRSTTAPTSNRCCCCLRTRYSAATSPAWHCLRLELVQQQGLS